MNDFNSELLLPWLSSEIKLILATAKTKLSSDSVDIVKQLCKQKIDWNYVLKLAYKNRVNCLLYYNLNKICPELIPETSFKKLREDFYTYTLNNQFFTQELVKLLKIFASHNIAAIPYKGPALALSLYRSLSLRYFSDLDILINPEDLVVVKSLLITAGYETTPVDDRQELDNINCDNERDFIRKDDKVVLDLHWRLSPNFFPINLPVSDLWSRCHPLTILNTPVANLSPEDLLLALCMHGAKECWHRLIWICDIAELINTYPELNWQIVSEQAESLGKERIIYLGLYLAKELIRTTIPHFIECKIEKDKTIQLLAAEVLKFVWGVNKSSNSIAKASRLTWFRWRTQESYSERLAYIYWRIFAPNYRDRRTIILPKRLEFIYYFIRPIRLIKEKVPWCTGDDQPSLISYRQ